MTAPSQRIEVITRGERRRRWSIEAKQEIVAESLLPGVRVVEVIRKYGISSGQLYIWRRQLTSRVEGKPPVRFARVAVVAAQRQMRVRAPTAEAVSLIASSAARGLIEIVLPTGTSVRLGAEVDADALRRVLDALTER
jgi:transposase